MIDEHESYGMISIGKFTGESQFFGSDLIHGGGVRLTISKAERDVKYSTDWFHPKEELIEVYMSSNQFVDAITSAVNTPGVPCTLKRVGDKVIPQIDHVRDRKEQFSNDMKDMHTGYHKRIDEILEMMDGNIGKRKAADIKFELGVLKSHIVSNTNFVMTCFNESMEKTVTEAKHSVSSYIDHRVHSLGIEGLRDQLQISIGDKSKKD